MVCLYIPVEIVFLALGKDIWEFLTYEDSRIQEVTIQRKHFSSAITPLFDKITHKLATIKKSRTLINQYSVEVICIRNEYWQNVVPFPEFLEGSEKEHSTFTTAT